VRCRELEFRNSLRLDQRDSHSPDPYDIASRNDSADRIDPLSNLLAAESGQPVAEALSPDESKAAAYVYLPGRELRRHAEVG
jgi:hypothetical protein